MQEDWFCAARWCCLSSSTVKETLNLCCNAPSPQYLNYASEKGKGCVISELGLERWQIQSLVANFLEEFLVSEEKGSGVGNEILLNPSLLFLDEPTSGLDSTTALQFVQMLHKIAHSLLYFGKASEAMLYFSSVGCSPLMAMNPAEFLIDLTNGKWKHKRHIVPLDIWRTDFCLETKGLT
ncbi:hypothetical protein DITRI_Ditri03aG0139800 [Diplodiscus trichospermus]